MSWESRFLDGQWLYEDSLERDKDLHNMANEIYVVISWDLWGSLTSCDKNDSVSPALQYCCSLTWRIASRQFAFGPKRCLERSNCCWRRKMQTYRYLGLKGGAEQLGIHWVTWHHWILWILHSRETHGHAQSSLVASSFGAVPIELFYYSSTVVKYPIEYLTDTKSS